MPHFELTDGTRLFAKGNVGAERIGIHLGSQATLEQVGTDDPRPDGDLPEIASNPPSLLAIAMIRATSQKRTFTVKATGTGTGELVATGGGGKRRIASLAVAAGDYAKHTDMEIDLLADICRSTDAIKIHTIRRMLNSDKEGIFEQHSTINLNEIGPMKCGVVCKVRGEQVFGSMSPIRYEQPYHEPYSSVTKRSDVRYKPQTILELQTKIRALLSKGIPVRVGVLDNPKLLSKVGPKLIAYFDGGHTVLIVGCNKDNDRFLYIDPWGWGSHLEYMGGIKGDTHGIVCGYLGIFAAVYDKDRLLNRRDAGLPNLLRQTIETEGTFNTARDTYLEVVSGP